MKRVALLAVVSLSLSGCVVREAAPLPRGEAGLAGWNARHPEAARDLCRWAAGHQDAARKFFDWEAKHPGKTEVLVVWTVEHPNRGIDAFVADHPRWDGFDWMTETHHPAANAFMAWIRQHPEAARDLAHHPGGLEYASRAQSC